MNHSDNQPSFTDRLNIYQKSKEKDAASIAGAVGSTALGGTLGGVAATGIAGWFGSNIITTSGLGTLLNLLPAGLLKAVGIPAVVTITTPVSWVIGSIAVCAGIGYGIYRLANRGGKNDQKRSILGKNTLEKIRAIFEQRKASPQLEAAFNSNSPAVMAQVESLFQELGKEGAIAADKVDYFVNRLKSGKLSLDDAIAVLRDCGKELINPTVDSNAPNSEIAIQRAASARALTVMHKGVTGDPNQPNEPFLQQMNERFGINRERALELYQDAPLDINPGATAAQLAQMFNQMVIQDAFCALEETTRGMQRGQAAFVRFLEVQQALQQQFNTQIAEIDRAGEDAWAAINRI